MILLLLLFIIIIMHCTRENLNCLHFCYVSPQRPTSRHSFLMRKISLHGIYYANEYTNIPLGHVTVEDTEAKGYKECGSDLYQHFVIFRSPIGRYDTVVKLPSLLVAAQIDSGCEIIFLLWLETALVCNGPVRVRKHKSFFRF